MSRYASRLKALSTCLVILLVSAQAWAHGAATPAGPANETAQAGNARSGSAELAEELTRELLQGRTAHLKASPRAQDSRLEAVEAIAAERRELLVLLVDSDPGQVLRLALPGGVRAAFPASVQKKLEREVSEEGVLTVIHVDMPGEGIDRFLYTLKTTKGERTLHFAGAPTTLLTGSRIRVKGIALDDDIVLASGAHGGGVTTLAAAFPNTYGVQKTLVILVNFSDLPSAQPMTKAQAETVVFGTTSAYDFENSYQQTSLQGDVTPWYTIAATSAGCDYNLIATQAEQAAIAGGYVLGNYTRYLYAFPANACTWWGLGTVGGNPSRAWIYSQRGFTNPVVAHEFGHNFGLRHSHSLDCGSSVVGDDASCTSTEYGDVLDIMGGTPNGASAHFNAFQKELLGWLNDGALSPPLTTVQSGSAQYSIGNIEAARNSTPRALKIGNTLSSCNLAPSEWYYVEKREPVGFDNFLGNFSNTVSSGVVLHRVTGSDPDSSYLLDMSPETTTWHDVALVAGKTFTDPVTGLQIKPVSVGSGYADVQVTYAPASCLNPPSVKLSPTATQWKSPGSSMTYAVTVGNADSCNCQGTAYAVSAVLPAGWTATSQQTAVLAPGASGTVNITLTVSAGATQGFYSIPIKATSTTNAAKTASQNAAMSILVPIVLGNGVPVTPISASKGEALLYSLSVPVGKTSLVFTTSGGTGDTDIYVKRGSLPSTSVFDCKSEGSTNAETCTFTSPLGGVYQLLLNAFSDIGGVTLTGQYFPADAVTPTLSIGDATVSEGNAGTKLATFTASLSQVSANAVSFDIATSPGTANPSSDYVEKSTLGLAIPAGQGSATFSVTINGDTVVEPHESFTVNLGNVSGATVADGQAMGRITNDDVASLSIADVSVTEGNSGALTARFVVTLSSPMPIPVSFTIGTSNASATAGSDYVARSQAGRYMDAGRTQQFFDVTVNGDAAVEPDETFNVTLSSVTGATLGDGSAVGTIIGDDLPAAAAAAKESGQSILRKRTKVRERAAMSP